MRQPTVTQFIAGTLVLGLLAPPGVRAQSCGCEVTDAEEDQFDLLLVLSPADRAQALQTHLPWGVPEAPTENERLLYQTEWITNYDDDLRAPTWVAYRLRAEDVVSRTRHDCFRRDPRLLEDAAAFCEDYQEATYDRGHMVPRADMNRSEAAMVNTFVFSNMVPQHDRFNREAWGRLEGRVRDWAEEKEEIFVITGAIFDRDETGGRDSDHVVNRMPFRGRVAVPTHFYKILLHERDDDFIETMTFVFRHQDFSPDNDDTDQFLTESLTSIDRIEELTGIDFLPALAETDPQKEFAVERSVAAQLWPRD